MQKWNGTISKGLKGRKPNKTTKCTRKIMEFCSHSGKGRSPNIGKLIAVWRNAPGY